MTKTTPGKTAAVRRGGHEPGWRKLSTDSLAVGVPAALGFATLIENLLFGVGACDPVSFIAGILVLCVAAMLACYVPVRRALAVDPIGTLRAE